MTRASDAELRLLPDDKRSEAALNAKVQLNLYVPKATMEAFREQALKAGFGTKASSYLERLTQVGAGDLKYVYKALKLAMRGSKGFLSQSKDQKKYALEIVLLLGNLLEKGEPENETDPEP